ncbi:hypothetical protein ACWCOW_38165 [Streptomyces sp. NPDC001939]
MPFAKQIVPGLPSYGLDTLLARFSIAQPADRHRAAGDVEVTAMVFMQLIRAADRLARFSVLLRETPGGFTPGRNRIR